MHVVKAVCLDSNPVASSNVTLFCLSPQGHPLATGCFKTEEAQNSIFEKYAASDSTHKVMDVIFTEHEEADTEGIIIAIRDASQSITHDNLERLRSTT